MNCDDDCIFHLEINDTQLKTKQIVKKKVKNIGKTTTKTNINTHYLSITYDIFKRNIMERCNPLNIIISTTPISNSPLLSSEIWHLSPRKQDLFINSK